MKVELILLGIVLLLISYYDFISCIIPNLLVVVGIVINIVYCFEIKRLLFSSLLTISLVIIVIVMNYLFNKDMMGMGDIKLIFMLGLYTNMIDNIKAIFIACILGIVWMFIVKKKVIPFGPFICIGYMLFIYL